MEDEEETHKKIKNKNLPEPRQDKRLVSGG